jgi:histidine ammonia-lyase
MMGMTFVAFVAVWMIGEGVARFEGQRRRGFTAEDAEDAEAES